MMNEVKLSLNKLGNGAFFIMDGAELLGEMVVNITGSDLTVYHTEVSAKAEGKGFAKKLLAAMVDHARNNNLKVIALCPYVYAQFIRHPDEYADIWKKVSSNQ
ncbi:N-acetyltransferase [Chitinophagaceae bacterium LB-8]|uniref:N-acetyltransferase n=1 Tax=Paraflavisolibacter caeni TaxID=2982496 RepID=A0A9X2XVK1_9BACT|nr:GNAT family N-acetyltransferase [Paraflavisolibacter caeni]MCU7549372.1 N-acetyltransferase [Paraflavisolibacter caeni]